QSLNHAGPPCSELKTRKNYVHGWFQPEGDGTQEAQKAQEKHPFSCAFCASCVPSFLPRVKCVLLSNVWLRAFHLLRKFSLQGFQVKRRAFLHGRVLDETVRGFGDLLLNQNEAPELCYEPVVIRNRTVVFAVVHTSALERVQADIGEDRPVHFHC